MLNPVDEAEIGEVAGLRVPHLRCHFGADTLCLAQRGARWSVSIFQARRSMRRARSRPSSGPFRPPRFVRADLYDAGCHRRARRVRPESIQAGASPAGARYHALGRNRRALPETRRTVLLRRRASRSYVFDDRTRLADGRPGYFAPYFGRQPLVLVEHKDYADPTAHLANATNVEWLHPLSDILGGLIDAGLSLDWLHEHAQVPWRMFEMLVQKDDGDWHWPDKPWLPLAVSLQASRRG